MLIKFLTGFELINREFLSLNYKAKQVLQVGEQLIPGKALQGCM